MENYIHRIIQAYIENINDSKASHKDASSMWTFWIEPKYESVIQDIMTRNEEKVSYHLQNPRTNFLTFGFDNLFLERVEGSRESLPFFFKLCRANDLLRVPWPENPTYATILQQQETNASVEELLLQLDDYFGFKIDFPNIFKDEFGFPTSPTRIH
jgi:hypothetical protein